MNVRGWYYMPSPFILVGTLLLSAYNLTYAGAFLKGIKVYAIISLM